MMSSALFFCDRGGDRTLDPYRDVKWWKYFTEKIKIARILQLPDRPTGFSDFSSIICLFKAYEHFLGNTLKDA